MLGTEPNHSIDLNEVKGQDRVKRAMEIAAAGYHNMIMVGPPWLRQNHAC